MQKIISARQAKEIDRYTIENVGIPSMVLMERAALEVVYQVEKQADKEPGRERCRILVLCGTGNNGGDGIAVARILHQKGYLVACQIVGNEDKASEDQKLQKQIAENLGVSFVNQGKPMEYTIIVDALFGIGLSREIQGTFAEWIAAVNQTDAYKIAVDMPSGIHTDTGQVMGCAVRADLTVTFGYGKTGLYLYPGAEYAGTVLVAEIGFAQQVPIGPCSYTFTRKDLKEHLPVRPAYSNKGTFGKVLVIAGSKNMAGAAYLSARAACTMGAGLVKVITPEENRQIIQELLPEAVLHTYDNKNLEQSIAQIEQDILQAKAIVIGPGMGLGDSAGKLLELVLQVSKVPMVIDADALQLLAKDRERIPAYDGEELHWHLPEQAILTPHLKEMADLMGNRDAIGAFQQQKIQAWQLCRKNQNILVLKDARTLVIQGEKCYINLSGNSGLATAGSGDVLTGIILGLLGQGVEPYEAATLGVYIHGLAGEAASAYRTEYSVTARDIIEALPQVLGKVEGGYHERIF